MYTTTFIGDNDHYSRGFCVKRAKAAVDGAQKPAVEAAEFAVIKPVKEEKIMVKEVSTDPAPVADKEQEAPVTEKKARKPRAKKTPTATAAKAEEQQ